MQAFDITIVHRQKYRWGSGKYSEHTYSHSHQTTLIKGTSREITNITFFHTTYWDYNYTNHQLEFHSEKTEIVPRPDKLPSLTPIRLPYFEFDPKERTPTPPRRQRSRTPPRPSSHKLATNAELQPRHHPATASTSTTAAHQPPHKKHRRQSKPPQAHPKPPQATPASRKKEPNTESESYTYDYYSESPDHPSPKPNPPPKPKVR